MTQSANRMLIEVTADKCALKISCVFVEGEAGDFEQNLGTAGLLGGEVA